MGRYMTILADPPWSFDDKGTRLCPQYAGRQREERHYSVEPTLWICELGARVRELACDDSFLFLWSPNSLVLSGDAARVADAWGFVPKQLITWLKTSSDGSPRIGGGHYTRVCTEQLLLCRRGHARVMNRSTPGVIISRRTSHSRKPDCQYEYIESLSPGPYLEMFARSKHSPEWDVWGDEVRCDVDIAPPTHEAAGRD